MSAYHASLPTRGQAANLATSALEEFLAAQAEVARANARLAVAAERLISERAGHSPTPAPTPGDGLPADTPTALRVEEAAKLLGISRDKAFELIAAGQLRVIKAGRRTIVPRTAVAAFLNGVTLP